VVVEGTGSISNVTVDFPCGSALVHRIGTINITVQSDCDGDTGLWPDPLIPLVDPFVGEHRGDLPITLNAGRQVFWVDLFVSPGHTVAQGACTAMVSVDHGGAAGSPVLTAELPVHVLNISLPSTSSRYATTFGFRALNAWDNSGAATDAERVASTQEYVDLGLMHRLTFNGFLAASATALAAEPPDWTTVDAAWRPYITGGVDTPFGLKGARVTSVDLPPQHYQERSPPSNSTIDTLWHATGCAAQTPAWGYAYWGGQEDCGAADMFSYCQHLAEGKHDAWSRTCGSFANATRECQLQPQSACPPGNTRPNNTRAYAFWRSAYAFPPVCVIRVWHQTHFAPPAHSSWLHR
jgi:hypothetical protein